MGLISNGTTIFDAGAISLGGSMKFISKATASSSATIDFTSGIDSTYKEYLFLYDVHPQSDQVNFAFQVDVGTGTSYGQTITSTSYNTYHNENDGAVGVSYNANHDQVGGTGFQNLNANLGNDNDQNCAGYLHLFNPADTTFVKHFIGESMENEFSNVAHGLYVSGFVDTTTALTRVRFKMSSGNIDAGTISLYGIS